MNENLISNRLRRYSRKCITERLDPDFADAVVEAAKMLDISRPVVRGKWVDTEPDKPDWTARKSGMSYYCSNCKHSAGKFKHKTYKFCPWCGADMRGG